MKPFLYLAPIAFAGLVACSPSSDAGDAAGADVEPSPAGTIEPDPYGPAADPNGASNDTPDADSATLEKTFPEALRGKWRLTDGPGPTPALRRGNW